MAANDLPVEAKSTHHRAVRVLLTAFGGFPGAAINPTQAIAVKLSKTRRGALRLGGIELLTESLPVEYGVVENRITNLLAHYQPDCVLHLGLAGARHKISVETRGRNRLNTIHPDAAGRRAGRMTCASDADDMRQASYRALRILSAMHSARADAVLSIDAGDYLCNQALFSTLGQFEGPAGFIHVPRPRRPSRPVRIVPSPRMGIEVMTRAVETAIRDMAQQVRSHKMNDARAP